MKLKRTPAFLLTVERNLEQGMITLGPLLVFLVATALPVIFLLIARRWIEADDRAKGNKKHENRNGPLAKSGPAEISTPVLPFTRRNAPPHSGVCSRKQTAIS
jgi:hypothetical protein